jgi:hypothetical protein
LAIPLPGFRAGQEFVLGNLEFVKYDYSGTKNSCYGNRELIFARDSKRVVLNQKIPFDHKQRRYMQSKTSWDCALTPRGIYTIRLRPTCLSAIPKNIQTYYGSNAVVLGSGDCSRFYTKTKDTEYREDMTYGNYVDMDGRLYEVVGITPNGKNYCHW